MPSASSAARRWILLSAVLHVLIVPVAAIPDDNLSVGHGAVPSVWLFLLALVWLRRSRAARAVCFVWSMTWGVMFTLGGLSDAFAEPGDLLVALVFLGQALPLITSAVRDHVQKRDAGALVPAAA